MKKALAMVLAVILAASMISVVSLAEEDEEQDEELLNMKATVSEWDIETMPESFFDINLSPAEQVIYYVTYTDGVLDITLKGKETGKEDEWDEAWEKAYLESDDRSDIFMNIAFGSDLDGKQYMINSGDESVKNHFEKNYWDYLSYFNKINISNSSKGFTYDVAKVTRESGSREMTIIPETDKKRYENVVIYDEEEIKQYIYIVYIHCEDTASVCETLEPTFSEKKIVKFNNNGLPLDYEYDPDTGVFTIRYTGSSDTAEEIWDELYTNANNRYVSFTLYTPADGYYPLGSKNTEETTTDIEFYYTNNGEFVRSVKDVTMEWTDGKDRSTYKFQIKFELPEQVKLGKTWMDSIASPTDSERITYMYDSNEITTGDLESETNMRVEYVGSDTGFIHIQFPNNALVPAYNFEDNLYALIAPKDSSAVKYRIYSGNTGKWSDPDDYLTNYAKDAFANMEIKSIQDDGLPQVNLDFFKNFSYKNSTIYYTDYTGGNEVSVIWWYDEAGDRIESCTDYVYFSVDDYLWMEESYVYESESDVPTPVETPIVVGKGLGDSNNKIKVQLFPQEGGSGYYLKLVEKGGWEAVEGEQYVVFFPFHYFGYKNLSEALDSMTTPFINHLTNANTLKETIIGEYTKHGVKFVVGDFSPFYNETKFYNLVRNNEQNEKGRYKALSDAIENASETDYVTAGKNCEAELRKECKFRIRVAENISVELEAANGLEIYVNGINKGSKTTLIGTGKIVSVEIKETEEPVIPIPVPKKKSSVNVDIKGITENTPDEEENPNTGAEKLIGMIAIGTVISVVAAYVSRKK